MLHARTRHVHRKEDHDKATGCCIERTVAGAVEEKLTGIGSCLGADTPSVLGTQRSYKY